METQIWKNNSNLSTNSRDTIKTLIAKEIGLLVVYDNQNKYKTKKSNFNILENNFDEYYNLLVDSYKEDIFKCSFEILNNYEK